MDIFWCITMRSVWASKPWNNHTTWAVFDYLRTITLILSYVNIGIKIVIILALMQIKNPNEF